MPFVVAFPTSTFDSNIQNGVKDIPIEIRDETEVVNMLGLKDDKEEEFRIAPIGTNAVNYGFDVTPSRLINAYFTEKGVFSCAEEMSNKLCK